MERTTHPAPLRVLLIDEKESDYVRVQSLLNHQGGVRELFWASDIEEGARVVGSGAFDACLVDQELGDGRGLELVAQIRRDQPEMAVLVVTSEDSIELDSAALRAGAHGFLCKDQFSATELIRALRYAVEQAQRCAELSRMARRDSVTGLHNRVSILEQLTKLRGEKATGQGKFAICLVDLDDFKGVNDESGHAAGDEVLREVGSTLRAGMRPSDAVGRIGGDEFLIVFGEVAGSEEALRIARRLHKSLAELPQPHYPTTRASFGLAIFPEHGSDNDSLLEAADQAMYSAKRAGKGRIAIYSHQLESGQKTLDVQASRSMADALSLVFQPQIQLSDGAIVGFEALSRYRSGHHSIEDIVRDLKESDRILELDRWAVDAAVLELQRRVDGYKLSVNISPSSLERGGLVEQLAKKNPSLLRNLELEITESEPFSNLDLANRVLVDIRQMGVKVALDDFGMAYSSLERLQALPIDTLKLGPSLTAKVASNHRSSAIAACVSQLARRLNVEMVAEGIESAAVAERLQTFGVEYGQGYYFARPMPAEELGPWLNRLAASA